MTGLKIDKDLVHCTERMRASYQPRSVAVLGNLV